MCRTKLTIISLNPNVSCIIQPGGERSENERDDDDDDDEDNDDDGYDATDDDDDLDEDEVRINGSILYNTFHQVLAIWTPSKIAANTLIKIFN